MIVGNIEELSIIDVFDRGVPNRECIAIAVNTSVNLGQYGLFIGVRGPAGFAMPIKDNLFWFGDGIVNRDDWIFVYTGPGSPRANPLPNTSNFTYSVHWGRNLTVFFNPELVPILFRIDAVIIGKPPTAALPRQ